MGGDRTSAQFLSRSRRGQGSAKFSLGVFLNRKAFRGELRIAGIAGAAVIKGVGVKQPMRKLTLTFFPRLIPWLTALLAISLLAVFTGLGALPASAGIPWRLDPQIFSVIAGALCLVWIGVWIRSLFLFRWHGAWLFLVSPGVIFLIAGVWMWNKAVGG